MPALLEAASNRLPEFSADQTALLIECLAMSTPLASSKAAGTLRDKAVAAVEELSNKLSVPVAASLAPALTKLRLGEAGLANALGERLKSASKEPIGVQELAVAAASLVTLRSVDTNLLLQVQKTMEKNVHLCTPRGVVHFCNALTHMDDPDAFRDYLMPAVRSFLMDFNARDVCSIAEAFTKVGAMDTELLNDLAYSLQPKVKDMGAHEVSVALTLFLPVAYANPKLLPAIVARLDDLLEDLSPRQLARTLQGLAKSGCGSAQLFKDLRDRTEQLAHAMYGVNTVDALMALLDAGHLNSTVLQSLLGIAARTLDRITPADHIALLHLVANVPADLAEFVPPDLAEDLIAQLRQRRGGPWRMSLDNVVYTFEALHKIRREDEVLVELICRRLSTALKQADCSVEFFARAIEAITRLPRQSQQLVRTHFQRHLRIQSGVRYCVQRQLIPLPDLQGQVALAKACAQIGFESEFTQRWLDTLAATVSGEELRALPPESTCNFSWALAQLNWQIEWNRRQTRDFLRQRYAEWVPRPTADDSLAKVRGHNSEGDDHKEFGTATRAQEPVQVTPLLRLGLAVAVLNEELPPHFLQEVHDVLDGQLPADWLGEGLQMLQAIVSHWDFATAALKSDIQTLPHEVLEWLQLVREAPRADLVGPQVPPRAQRYWGPVVIKRYPHELWLSAVLTQLNLPHARGQVVGFHRAAIIFPKQQQLIDVLGVEDLSAPAGRMSGCAELRRRQFMEAGWAVHPVKLKDLYDASQKGKLRLLVSKLLAAFDPAAARKASFQTSNIKGQKLVLFSKSPRQAAQTSGVPPEWGALCEEEEAQDESDKDDKTTEADAQLEEQVPWFGGSLRPRGPREKLRARAFQAVTSIAAADAPK